ncbi:cAMP-regulated phosphoprotein 21 isoform X2 [Brienomyrus brachyistius]|uniref:cAMP-regulated phosphoprotein 21 isoform X2 n=1 Tax=Brienomyrus brachyistius TaxID=42636 RepID=UPI0020B2D98F|nr:cAMP-regulated phosphoprotein 21 isoform X2 [Brienomyrus brachyistius]
MSELDVASPGGPPGGVGDELPPRPSPSPITPPPPVLCLPPSPSVEEDWLQGDARAEQQRRGLTQGHPRKRPKAKAKLVRSLAVCDESSPPFPTDGAECNQGSIQLQNTALPCVQEDGKPSRDDCEKDRSKETDRCHEKPKIRVLSKEQSQEYTDSTGIDLHDFLVNTLQKNPRDRMMLLKLEQEMIDFITDNSNPFKKFPQMSSYHRMLVHRVAAYFGMDHNVDQSGKSVIINKTSNTRIPDQRFGEYVKDEKGEDSQKRFILKRDNSSIDKDDNLQHRIHPFKDDRRSKSMEEREEEYQRARDRIFAQDSVSSQENIYIETRIVEDCNLYNDIQKKRQLFRGNRDGSSRASGSRQSSTETDSRWNEPRPWSSTDSDSSSRNYRPAVTKTASIGGITVLTRGDGGTSGRCSGKLSKAGSESSSSGGSSGSLSRVHLALQGPTLLPAAPPSSGGSMSFSESQGPPSSPSYILVSLDGAGIPPGSILLNPHTGQPFVNPDGTPAIYNPPVGQQPIRSQLVGQSQHQATQQSQQPLQQPPGQTQTQQPISSHLVPQALAPSAQAVPYSPVSYSAQHLLPTAPGQAFSPRDAVSSQFGQMSLSRQPSGDAAEPTSTPVYPPGVLAQAPQQASFVMTSPAGGFTGSGPGPALSQQTLQASPTFAQQGPSQVPMYYFSSGQYPTSNSTQYRTTPVQYSTHRNQQISQNGSQQTGYQPLSSNQQQAFQGVMGVQQPPQSQNLMSSNQPANQVQGMMVPYPPMSSYQVPMNQASPAMAPPSYQQPLLLPGQPPQGALSSPGVPVYCSMMPPSPPGGLRLVAAPCGPSSSVPVVQASCRTNCASISSAGWQVKY